MSKRATVAIEGAGDALKDAVSSESKPQCAPKRSRVASPSETYEAHAEGRASSARLSRGWASSVRLSRLPSRQRFRQARKEAHDRIAEGKGFPNRTAGAFTVPTEHLDEPERTERLLASPFAFTHTVAADAFHARLGFLFFRINGLTRFGITYRLCVLCVNVLLGAASGLTPLFGGSDSTAGIAQVASVMTVQLSMALLCFYYRPDADKVFSIFAGTQYLVEGLASACTLSAAFAPDAYGTRASLAFGLSLVAVFVPMTQLAEQRVLTPCLGVARTKGCSPLTLLGAVWLMLMGVPSLVRQLMTRLTVGGDDDAGGDNGTGDVDEGAIGSTEGADQAEDAEGTGNESGDEEGGERATSTSLGPDATEALGKATAKHAVMLAGGKDIKRVSTPDSRSRKNKPDVEDQQGEDGGDGGDD